MPPSVRRIITSLAAWVLGAGVAVGVGVLALSLIDSGLASGAVRPVPEDGPVVALPSPTLSPSDSPSAAPSASPSAAAPAAPQAPTASTSTDISPSATAGPPRQLASVGGTVIARCTGSTAYLVSWSPAQGYEADEVYRGPARTVSVVFEGNGQRVWLGVYCVAGIPERASGHHNE